MKIFRKREVEDEQVKQAEQKQEQKPEQKPDENYGESESIPVFKGQGKRKTERAANIRSKGKNLSDIEHR